MEKWLEDAKVRIKDFKKSHHLQRIQLELAFETAPRDSRYSNSLIDMMRKEEQIVAKDPNSPVTKSVIQKVDDSLRAETRGFFAKSVQKNVKKWSLVKEKFERETRQFTTGLTDEMRAYSNMKGPHAGMVRKNRTPTPEELDEEAERLEADYNLNWYKYENFSLQEAFKSQNNRIENDWATHEQTLEEEFAARKEKIAGPGAFGKAAASPQAQATHDPRWQHPEKQKTLIHTAPVMSPTRASVGGSLDSQGWAKGKDNAAIAAELERIQREHEVAVAAMQKQKSDAKRWLLRQQVRLQAQAVEVQWERSAIAEILQEDCAALHALTRALNALDNQ